jgi:ATP-dependent exoDNAse (exonuclease V) alpha subunit
MTIHRVQGATLTGPVHILLNREIFAEGQAYVALSRVQKLEQLHLWCLHRDALKGNATVDAEYVRLAGRLLDDEAIAAAPPRARVRHLLPLVATAAQ